MTITYCEMQSKDCTTQIIFCKNLNDIIEDNWVPIVNLKGFMVDNVKANWNLLKIYGHSDLTLPMVGCEYTCFFPLVC